MKGKNLSFIYRAGINECGKSKSLVVFPITEKRRFPWRAEIGAFHVEGK